MAEQKFIDAGTIRRRKADRYAGTNFVNEVVDSMEKRQPLIKTGNADPALNVAVAPIPSAEHQGQFWGAKTQNQMGFAFPFAHATLEGP